MSFGRWFYNTEQLSQSETNFGELFLYSFLRDFTIKRIRNIQLFSNTQWIKISIDVVISQ